MRALAMPVISPTIFGRQAQLAHLRRFVDELVEGTGGTILVTGEAGIGKTRLIGEARALASSRGVQVLHGAAFELDRALPYGPIVDLLRAFISGKTSDELVDAFGPSLVPLGRLLPALAAWMSPETDSHPSHENLHGLLTAFERLVERSPTMLVVEDVHWADEASLDLLLHLARLAAVRPVLVVVTLRADDASPVVVDWCNLIDRQRLIVELPLMPLARADVDAMVQSIVGDNVSSDVLETIAGLAEGNPFFIEEVVRTAVLTEQSAVQSASMRVPRSVHDAVQRRVNGLDESARRALQVAAVAGRRFDFSLLQLVLETQERDLLSILKELIAAQLVVEDADERFAFRHALTRQAVYADLLGRERRGLHAAVVRALEEQDASGNDVASEELSYHAHAAADWRKAARYASVAGDRALAMHAPRAAVEHFKRALESAEHLGQKVDAEVLRGRAQAYHDLGQFALAQADYVAALSRASDDGDKRLGWQLLVDLNLLWSGRDYSVAGQYAERSLAAARELDDSGCIARSLDRVGNWRLNVGQVPEALACQQQALAVLESSGDRRGVADTLNLLGMTSAFVDPQQSFGYYTRAIPLLREFDDRQGLVTALVMRDVDRGFYWGDTFAPIGIDVDREEVERDTADAIRLARSIEWPAGESYTRWELALWFGIHGFYARAFELAESALQLAEEVEHTQWICAALSSLGALYLDVLAPRRARPMLERAVQLGHELGSEVWSAHAAARLAMAMTLDRDFPSASAILQHEMAEDLPFETATQRQLWCARAEYLLARGSASDALAIAERLASTLPAGKVAPRVWILRGNAYLAVRAFTEGESALVEAIEVSRTCGIRAQQWRAHAAYARLLRARVRRDEAAVQIQLAHTLVHELAGELREQDLRSRFVEAACASMPRPGSSERRLNKQTFGGLTAREREVAALIGRGASNRTIAETLVIGERTVESYVSSILAKLGFTARTQIAAWSATRETASPTSKSPY